MEPRSIPIYPTISWEEFQRRYPTFPLDAKQLCELIEQGRTTVEAGSSVFVVDLNKADVNG